MQLPLLDEGGDVVFANSDDLELSQERYIKRGALAVKPARRLAPLEQLDVIVRGGWLPSGQHLRCEVVHLETERALLRLLDAPPLTLIAPRPSPALDVPSSTTVVETPHAPPPLHDDKKANTDGKGYAVTDTSSFDPPERNVLSGALPPYLNVDTLRFANAEDFRAAREHLEKVSALMAVCDSPPPAGSELDVQISLGNLLLKTRTRCIITPMSGGTVVVQASDLQKGFRALLAEIDGTKEPTQQQPSTTTRGTPVKGTRTGPLALSRDGVGINPTTAAGILALPVNRPPTEAEVRQPSMPLLLRWMRTQTGVKSLEITVEGQPMYTAVFVDGREVRAAVSMSTLGKALAMPECRYTLRDLPRAPNMSTTGRTLHLITEVVRGLMARVLVEELAAAFPDHKDECPRVLPYVIDGLGMPGTHTRLVKQAFQGDSTIADIQSCASGARVAWDTLYLLEMYGALAWQPAEPKSDSRASMAATPEQLLAALEAKDHFAVLGLHWSCSPTEIEPAYEKLKGELGPSGTRRVPSKDIADAMWRRVEGAHRVLSDTAMRKRYRQATFNRIWPTEAAQLVTKARLALYRRDLVEARTTLLAAQDLAHTVEGTELLAMITRNEG